MKITFLQTGGSIDKNYPKNIGGYSFEISEPAFSRILEKIQLNFDYEIFSILKKDSQDLTDEDRDKILKFCTEIKNKKIIITHGTDTILTTAEHLKPIKDKVIILTGSFIPERFKNSDADFNLGIAVCAVSILSEGIYIALNGSVYEINTVIRDKISGMYIKDNKGI